MQFDYSQILTKAMRYCAYQERCIYELRLKNCEWGLSKDEFEKLVVELKKDNFLNEERFVESYVRGKFQQKKWGKLKIRDGLYSKNIPSELIDRKLERIDNGEYLKTLKELFEKKMKLMGAGKENVVKVQRYLLSKGYEWEWIVKLKDGKI